MRDALERHLKQWIAVEMVKGQSVTNSYARRVFIAGARFMSPFPFICTFSHCRKNNFCNSLRMN